LKPFVQRIAQPGSTIRTDNLSGYSALADSGFEHIVVPSKELKLAHLIAALLKRWLLDIYQGL
jgi:hypothetical protein